MSSGSTTIKTLADGRAWVRNHRSLWDRAGLVLLSGPMGAGKTQLVQWMLEELGSKEASSPTFSIHQRYTSKERTVDHFDLYRLKSDDELDSCGYWEMVAERDNLVLVEWADRLPLDVYPANRSRLVLSVDLKPSGERTYSWSGSS